MEDYPRILAEFETRFAGEQVCREYLCQLRWPEGFRCPRCGHAKAWAVADGAAGVRRLWASSFGDGRHNISRHAQTPPELVSSNVVAHQPEERGERTGIAAGVGPGQLTRLPGHGCTSSGAPWCGPDAIDSAGAWRLTRPT